MNEKTSVYISENDLKNLKIMIEYLLKSEQKHYEETVFNEIELKYDADILSKGFYNNPKINHIYAITRRLKDSISL